MGLFVEEAAWRSSGHQPSEVGGVDHPGILRFPDVIRGGMVWRGGLVPMGPVSRHDLLSAVCVLIFGQFSALGINLLDRFVT